MAGRPDRPAKVVVRRLVVAIVPPVPLVDADRR
jgi:hypothetical protein